jgi:hypothetical protein
MIAKRFLESSPLDNPVEWKPQAEPVLSAVLSLPKGAVLSLSKGAFPSLSKSSVEGPKGHRRCSLLLLDM